jgi:hypothetical protein
MFLIRSDVFHSLHNFDRPEWKCQAALTGEKCALNFVTQFDGDFGPFSGQFGGLDA